MAASITIFPVGCGDMTLLKLADAAGTTVLVDINIRGAADDPDDDTRDVAKDLRDRIGRDTKNRPYVDAFLLTHPDADHIRGLQNHFWLGPLADYPDDDKPDGEKRIVIREMWSSPLVFRRACKNHTLCDDAKAFNTEAKRRVKVNRDKKFEGVGDGDRILVMGEDENDKTDDLTSILVKIDEEFSRINGVNKKGYFTATLLGPLPKQESDEEEENLGKNHSSVILNMMVGADAKTPDGCKFLCGGDAEVLIWERQWERHKSATGVLEYDLLLAPHHCSWHTLSWESWSKTKGKAKVSEDARKALSVTRTGAMVVASCAPIKDDDCDPPCIGAKREYEAIVKDAGGSFICVGEQPSEENPEPLELTVSAEGVSLPAKQETGRKSAAIITSASTPMPHGSK
jgi:hypothetical protein